MANTKKCENLYCIKRVISFLVGNTLFHKCVEIFSYSVRINGHIDEKTDISFYESINFYVV